MKICAIAALFAASLKSMSVAEPSATVENASDRAEMVFGYPTLSDAVTATQSECIDTTCLVEVGASQSLWDHPLIIDLMHGRPAPADWDHDLPTLRGRILSEDLDAAWAPGMERALALLLGSDLVLVGNHTQHQVRCGATLCKVVMVGGLGSDDEEIRKAAFGSFARLADRDLELDHQTSAYLTVDETPRMQSILAFFVRSEAPVSD